MAWIRARLCNACGARYTFQRRTSRYCSRVSQGRTPGPGTLRKSETRTSRESGRAGSWSAPALKESHRFFGSGTDIDPSVFFLSLPGHPAPITTADTRPPASITGPSTHTSTPTAPRPPERHTARRGGHRLLALVLGPAPRSDRSYSRRPRERSPDTQKRADSRRNRPARRGGAPDAHPRSHRIGGTP